MTVRLLVIRGVVGGISTLAAHQRQAEAVGPQTAWVIREQGRHKKHPAEALRSAKGILRLARDYSPAALEASAPTNSAPGAIGRCAD